MDRLINTWDQLRAAGGDRVAISYSNPEPRSCRVPCWRVWRMVDRREIKTDPKAAYYDNGAKSFIVHHPIRRYKAVALAEAIAWANATYGPRTFVRNRMGDMLEAEVNAKFPLPPRKRN